MTLPRRYFLLFTVFSALVACNPRDDKGEQLIGDWMLESAARQGRPTSTLDGLRFTFTDDSVYTNLPVFENHNYTYSEDTLIIMAKNPYVFHVFRADSSRLDLDGEIRNVHFRLNFQRIQP